MIMDNLLYVCVIQTVHMLYVSCNFITYMYMYVVLTKISQLSRLGGLTPLAKNAFNSPYIGIHTAYMLAYDI